MSRTTFIFIGILYYIFTVVLIIVVLNLINKKEKKKYQEEIASLERDKNLIVGASILSELNKVGALVNNDAMQKKYDNWQKRLKEIKEVEVPKITDGLIEIENAFEDKDYKSLKPKIASLELQIAYVKTKSNFLLDEIKEITLSEEKNRETITKLKSEYRLILTKYNSNKNDYGEVTNPIELQFENVDKLFSAFEVAMEKNEYTEVGKIVKAIDDTIGNLKIVVEEAPSIIIMGQKLIPDKIADIEKITAKMEKEGYNLDYLNIPYNITESEKKISDVFQRLNVLNLEDSVFELKTILDYFDSLYHNFDKERLSKRLFEDFQRSILIKVTKLEKISNDLNRKIDDLKYSYDLNDEDVLVLDVIANEIFEIKEDYNRIIDMHRRKVFAFSRLSKEMELLNSKLLKTEEKVEQTLRSLGSLKEDEKRAREQLDEIKYILNQAKTNLKSYKLPVTPKNFYVELSEAAGAISDMVLELDKRPISIKILNTRVDTARDLTLKVYNTTKEAVKTAKMAEAAIVYGNRYRAVYKDVELGLIKAENAFYKGNFKISLENAINAINIVEPGIHKKLLEEYQ
ncbi:septation ring formation regulator EzrA [Mycoplasma sp. CAG:776]|nr:septation ring formation regulator EzrA [Mycoplasma sp. CAG:776]